MSIYKSSPSALTARDSKVLAGVEAGNKPRVESRVQGWGPPMSEEVGLTLRQAAVETGYRSQYLRLLLLESAIPAQKRNGVWFLDRDVVEGLRKRRAARFQTTE